MLEEAIALHRKGRLKDAAALYRQFLNQNPRHAEALGLLGVTEVQGGNPEAGLELIDRAIVIEARNPILFNNRGNALRDLKRFEEALVAYDCALALKPDFIQALSNRGNALIDLKRFEEAVVTFDHALKLDPRSADAYFHRGSALYQLRRLDEAVLSFERALLLNARHADAHNNRGIALAGLKRLEDALVAFDSALAINSRSPGYFSNRGNVLFDLKRFEEALADLDAAIALRPGYAQAFYNRGIVLREMKRNEESLASFEGAIACDPGYAGAHSNRGAVLCDLKRFDEAIASLERAMALKPDYAEAFLNRGVVFRDMKRLGEAMADFEHALALDPDNADVLNAHGVALEDLERSAEAVEVFDRVLARKPDHPQAFYNRGRSLVGLRRFDEALSSYGRALALQPDYPDATFARGLAKLTMGELVEGWKDYEERWRIKSPAYCRRTEGIADWKGEDLKGRSILVYAEQGAGDEIQFIRYLTLLVERGAAVTFFVDRRHMAVLVGISDKVRLISSVEGGHYDFQCALMSLPYWLRTDLANIPASVPYLHADPERVDRWRSKLGANGFKVGIHWQGGLWQGGALITGRSFPLRALFPLSQIAVVRLISLQKNLGAEQLDDLPVGMAVERLEGFDDGPDSFVDTAAVMENLDLVITCDTSLAHLAGALARPTWVALKYMPDWRWMLDRADSPWYPTMRLFRQRTWGDWGGVFEEIAEALKGRVARR